MSAGTLLMAAVPLAASYYYGMWEFHSQSIRVKWKDKIIVEIPISERIKGIIKKIVTLYVKRIVIAYACLLALLSFAEENKGKRTTMRRGAVILGAGLLAIELISRNWQKIVQLRA